MTPKLTILVPNYNRPKALSRLLWSVFDSIDIADASLAVRVLVIDDFSSEPLDQALAPFCDRPNFHFRLQCARRGNAEAAFLGSLENVETEYTWLLGNDDKIMPGSVATILQVLRDSEFGLVLLNPRIDMGNACTSMPLSVTTPSVRYATCSTLFLDWGFVTSTTTFPCILFRTAPVARFHKLHRLDRVAQVYSHSFTLFSALRAEAGLYLAVPLVEFNLNHRLAEQEKLQRQSPGFMYAYHQSVGLGRLIQASAERSGKSIAEIGGAVEDELDKESNRIGQTTLAHFLTFYILAQLIWEHQNMLKKSSAVRHLSGAEIGELSETVRAFDHAFLLDTFGAALAVHRSGTMSARAKLAHLSSLQACLGADARARMERPSEIPDLLTPRKILSSSGLVTRLHGSVGDIHGRRL